MTGFHRDTVLQRMVDALVGQVGVTAFVETGTHHADTAAHMALRHPRLPIFTCEIDDRCHAVSAARLRPFGNVRLSKESSERFVARLVSGGELGGMPMFFLDAHWRDYWPLPDEIAAIAGLPRFIALVDDFEVPGHAWFETSRGGGGTIGVHRTKADNRRCNMGLIGHLLPSGCTAAYPAYGRGDAGNPPHLVGHVFILRGVGGGLEARRDARYAWESCGLAQGGAK